MGCACPNVWFRTSPVNLGQVQRFGQHGWQVAKWQDHAGICIGNCTRWRRWKVDFFDESRGSPGLASLPPWHATNLFWENAARQRVYVHICDLLPKNIEFKGRIFQECWSRKLNKTVLRACKKKKKSTNHEMISNKTDGTWDKQDKSDKSARSGTRDIRIEQNITIVLRLHDVWNDVVYPKAAKFSIWTKFHISPQRYSQC